MVKNIDRNKIILVAVICIILIIGGIWYFAQSNLTKEDVFFEDNFEDTNKNVSNIDMELNEITEEKVKIVVDISGQVVLPGVITLDEGSRLIDAINLAGGATKDANLSKVNLAYILSDAQKIYIPSVNDKEDTEYISEESGNGVVTSESTKESSSKSKSENLMININTANEEELQKLPGIGSSIASKIITYRKENGKFNTIEDIKNVSGIGESKFNNIKNNIYVK